MMSDPSENKEQLPKLYTPKEVAEMFGITSDALKQRRRRGQIKGIVFAENYVMYTEEQIRNADLSPKKRGPKPKQTKTHEQPEKKDAA
jgi:hypothetical protein